MTISGVIELRGGLAWLADTSVDLRHFEDGVASEAGNFDFKTGQFNIKVDQSRGVLVAKLLNHRTGEVVGQGITRLSEIPPQVSKTGEIKNWKIPLYPLTTSFEGRVLSAYSYDKHIEPVKDAKIELDPVEISIQAETDGKYRLEEVAASSTLLVRAQAPDYWTSQVLLAPGQSEPTLLFKNKMMSAFWDIVRQNAGDSLFPDTGSVVWGRVAFNGDAVGGLVIESENNPTARVIYFNRLAIPDPNLKATTENGLFAIVDLEEGFQSLVAKKNDQYWGHANTIVSPGAISVVDLKQTSNRALVDLRVFDGLEGTPVPAQITMQSLPESFVVDQRGFSTVWLPVLHRLSFLRADPGEGYEPSLHTYIDSSDHVYVQAVRSDWINQVRTSSRIDDSTNTGRIVGFVQDDDFEVFLPGVENFSTANIKFFDSAGRVIQSDHGVAGGGFAIFNVPTGPQAIVVLGKKHNKLYTQVTASDERSVSVLSFKLALDY
jgi:hypothetical protein